MADYTQDAVDALAAIRDAGLPVQIRRTTTGAYNPATGKPSQTTQFFDADAVLLDFNLQGAGSAMFEGSLIKIGDKKALLGVFGTTPAPGDALMESGVTWNVVNVKTLAPNGQAIIHTLHLRK